jgi:hypothetical protein
LSCFSHSIYICFSLIPLSPLCFFFSFSTAKEKTGRKENGEGEKAKRKGKVEVDRNEERCKESEVKKKYGMEPK